MVQFLFERVKNMRKCYFQAVSLFPKIPVIYRGFFLRGLKLCHCVLKGESSMKTLLNQLSNLNLRVQVVCLVCMGRAQTSTKAKPQEGDLFMLMVSAILS